MDRLTFVDQMLGHLLWPLVVLLVVLVFHKPLEELLRRITHIKAAGVEAAFDQMLKQST